MSRVLMIAALVLTVGTGCASRFLHTVTDGPGELTLIQTNEKKFLGFPKRVYWECSQAGPAKLTCVKVCDILDDQGDKLACPYIGGPNAQLAP